jgi:hypothetical protein
LNRNRLIFCQVLEHLISSTVFSGVRVAQSVVFCIVFCGLLFAFLSFFCRPLYRLSFFCRPMYRLSFELHPLLTSLVFFHTNIMMLGYTILHENSRVVIPGIVSIKAMSIHFKHGVIFHMHVHTFLNINV